MIVLTLDQKYETIIRLFDSKKDYKTLNKVKELKVFNNNGKEIFFDLKLNRSGRIYLSLNKKDKEGIRTLGYQLGKRLNHEKVTKVSLDARGFSDVIVYLIEGLLMSNYRFTYKKEEEGEQWESEVSLSNVDHNLILEQANLVNAIFTTRDLVNTPAIDLYPDSYAKKIQELFKDTSVDVEVLGLTEIKALKMEAFLAVNKGADNEPRFVVLKYLPNKEEKEHLTIVGKGVTYDTGGYAIKSAQGMSTMHTDMAGSAVVVGLFKALNDNCVNKNVVGVMALTENMISGKSYKNGDIINSMKGLTIEVGNTDAEGRLTLADALYYAATKLNSEKIIELSTLTGACIVALGTDVAGSISNNDELYQALFKESLETGESIWRLPIVKPLEDAVKGTFGDLKNSIPGGAGAITAGIFLTHFVEDKPFLHLDIAGVSYGKKRKYYSEGASGFGVKTLYSYIKNK